MTRRDELAAGLGSVEERVRAACTAAGRAREDVTVVVVTKTWPESDVRLLADLGVREVAENKDQEAAAKQAACADLPLRWHFVGQLQTNKASSVVRYADVVHSVDRPRLVSALSRAAVANGRSVRCLVQVALDARPGQSAPAGELGPRGGVSPADVTELAEAVAAADGLELGGLMAVAPREAEPAQAFAQLADLAATLRGNHPDATWVSAGMSGDLEAAVAAGATHLRVGTAVFGSRPRLR